MVVAAASVVVVAAALVGFVFVVLVMDVAANVISVVRRAALDGCGCGKSKSWRTLLLVVSRLAACCLSGTTLVALNEADDSKRPRLSVSSSLQAAWKMKTGKNQKGARKHSRQQEVPCCRWTRKGSCACADSFVCFYPVNSLASRYFCLFLSRLCSWRKSRRPRSTRS